MDPRLLETLARIAALPHWFLAVLALLGCGAWLAIVRSGCGGTLLGRKALALVVVGVLLAAVSGYSIYRIYKSELRRLGRNLPAIELITPRDGQRFGDSIRLLAHATDKPGKRGPIAAVRSVEFWLYHPAFAEQHAGNHESKVLLATVAGPTEDDRYEASWNCRNPYTPDRDGDHSGGAGTRTYDLPRDGRPYRVQAHGLDDEWFEERGAPAKSEFATIEFEPCG